MARKNYGDEFRCRAVDLFESTPGATITAIADDLGVSRGALKTWVDRYGTGAIGSSADNALAESFERGPQTRAARPPAAFPDQATAYRAVFRWATRYNTRRRHLALDNITPNTYETAAAATLPEAPYPN